MASTIRSIVYSAASHSVPGTYSSSGLIWNAVSFAHTIHRSYHFLARLDRFTRLENAPPILLGVALEMAVGDKKIVNFVAKTLESSLHTLKGINAYIRLVASLNKFQKLLSFKEGNYKKIDLIKELEHPYFSPSTLMDWIQLKNRYKYTFFHLIDAITEIAANFFLLSSHMVAACEAMQGHELQVIEAPMNIRDIFKEAYELNKGTFVDVNDQILKGLGAKFDTRSLYSHFQQVKKEKEGEFQWEFPQPDVEKTFDTIKKWGQHFMSKIIKVEGLHAALPKSMVVLSPFEASKKPLNFHTVIIHKNLK